jgi:hypothetical protein
LVVWICSQWEITDCISTASVHQRDCSHPQYSHPRRVWSRPTTKQGSHPHYYSVTRHKRILPHHEAHPSDVRPPRGAGPLRQPKTRNDKTTYIYDTGCIHNRLRLLHCLRSCAACATRCSWWQSHRPKRYCSGMRVVCERALAIKPSIASSLPAPAVCQQHPVSIRVVFCGRNESSTHQKLHCTATS